MPLISLSRTPPCGWVYRQPETGWSPEKTLTTFNLVVRALQRHRAANPHLQLDASFEACSADVQEYIVKVLKGDSLWCVTPPGETPKKAFATPVAALRRVARGGAAADGVRRVAAGASILFDWLGEGGQPVDRHLAESRAGVCAVCPKNGQGDWKSFFTGPITRVIRIQLAMRSDLELRTSRDEELGVCTGCDCPLKLKVWVPLKHQASYTAPETLERLDPSCWMPKEMAADEPQP